MIISRTSETEHYEPLLYSYTTTMFCYTVWSTAHFGRCPAVA